MAIGTTIDNTVITNITIDGTDVTEITIDGNVCYSKNPPVLRNIQVGDNLADKTIYLNFPANLYASLPSLYNKNIIGLDGSALYLTSSKDGSKAYIRYEDFMTFTTEYLYDYDISSSTMLTNLSSYTIVNYVGDASYWEVMSIDTSHPAYQYIKIID